MCKELNKELQVALPLLMRTDSSQEVFMNYHHDFDPGVFVLFDDNGDGTALFYEETDPANPRTFATLPSVRTRRYPWSQMRKA